MSKINLSELKSLYENLGEEKLEKILIEFYQKMSQDVLIGFFFSGKDPRAVALKQKEFLLSKTGGVKSYSGKPPSQAHLKLPPIFPGHFDRRIEILKETLKKHDVSDEDMRIWVRFEKAFRKGVVTPSQ